ncbi:MAG: hypothetical protein JWP81_2543 [Ferruginibacter sp.]|nr:hypothetical protein [Ferruginibacter sp.]
MAGGPNKPRICCHLFHLSCINCKKAKTGDKKVTGVFEKTPVNGINNIQRQLNPAIVTPSPSSVRHQRQSGSVCQP